MDLIKILNAQGIEGESAELIETAIKGQLNKEFIPKAQYNKKVQELYALKEEADDLRAQKDMPNEFEAKYNDALTKLEALQGDYDAYKQGVETKEVRSTINSKVTKMLNGEGFTNEKVVSLLLKNLDYEGLKLEGDDLVGFDLNAFTEGYDEFKTVRNTEGTGSITPPTNTTDTDIDLILSGYN